MKRSWPVVMALAVLFPVAEAVAARPGDVNDDGKVDAADLMLVARHLSEGLDLGSGADAADVAPLGAPDAAVDAGDLALLGRIVAPCAGASSPCLAVRDANGDGDIGPDIQETINRLLWPDGAATAAEEVVLAAPPPGTWSMTTRLRICGSATAPSGAAPPICDGTSPPAPVIVWDGLWSGVKLGCDLGDPLSAVSQCLRIGDGWNDGLADAQLTQIRFEGRPTIEVRRAPGLSDYHKNLTALWCDGCTGSLRAAMAVEIIDEEQLLLIPFATAAAIVGPRLESDLDLREGHRADGELAPFSEGVVIDGRQDDSVLRVRHRSFGSGESFSKVGRRDASIPFAFAGELTPYSVADGCDYNGSDYACEGLRVVNDLEGHVGWVVADGIDLAFEGRIKNTTLHPPFSFRVGRVQASIEGTVECSGSANSCIRAGGPETDEGGSPVPDYFDLFVDAHVKRIEQGAPTPTCPGQIRGGVNVFAGHPPPGGLNPPPPPDPLAPRYGKITLGPNFLFTPHLAGDDAVRCDQGGYTTSHDATDHVSSVNDWSQPIADIPQMCVRLDGTPGLLECSDARTKVTAAQRSWISQFRVEVTEAVPASRTCDLSVLVGGAAPNKWFLRPIPFGATGLRQVGEFAEHYINHAFVDPNPVQVAVLPPSAASATRCPSPPCTCSGVDGLAVTLETFPLAQGPPDP